MYKILRSILFLFPTEWVHYFSMNCLRLLCSVSFLRKLLAISFSPGTSGNLKSEIDNLQFKNPVGLGAGFDKNAKYIRELETLGFGFIEIGTVTPRSQSGNDKPRLFRLPTDKALINRMGFNNDGVDIIACRLKTWKTQNSKLGTQDLKLIIGGNIGKNKTTPNEDAWKDYEICFRSLHPYVDFFVVNVSSPNTPGLRELQEKEALKKILTHLQQLNQNLRQQKPILLKIAPDLTWPQIDDVIDLATEINLDGLVATNTTINRTGLKTDPSQLQNIGPGGLSGEPLQNRSTEITLYIHEKTRGTIPVIGSGGIFTGKDAPQKLTAGAQLVEVWTGFIYEGPFIVKRICKEIL